MTDADIVALVASAGLSGDVTDVERMLGGASRETWALRLDERRLVVRRDPPGAPRGGAMGREAVLLRAAAAVGVPVPEVVASGDDYIVMQRLDGETLARRILRDDAYAVARQRLTQQCAQALAHLHTRVAPDDVDGIPADDDPLGALRDHLDALGEPHPALELGLLRLSRRQPPTVARTVVHGDFRLGNLVVDATGLVGVLDWELAHIGDPAEDLGWMCVRSWRFGGPHPVAGVGTREQLLSSYADAGGPAVDEATLRWWEGVGTLRWGVICIRQAAAHLSGAVRSVELAAIGRRTCEVELDLLDLVAPPPGTPSPLSSAADLPGLHDRPTAGELVDAVAEWLDGIPLSGHDAFVRRVAVRSMRIVQREAALAPAIAARQQQRLQALAVAGVAELAAQIRAGRDDDATVAAVREMVVDKVVVADPRQLER